MTATEPVGSASLGPPVAVLGMHRSGTSCLAGSLEEAGLFLGQVNTKAPFNARGNRENRALMDLHDVVLADNKAAWDTPPSGQVRWSDARREERERLLQQFFSNAHGMWGFKDPRTLLVLDGWLERFPAMRMVGTFRHPRAVAASLAHRNAFDERRSMSLWLDYNQRLLAAQERCAFPLVSFDGAPGRYLEALQTLARDLGLQAPEGGFTFFQASLRRNTAEQDDAGLPTLVGACLTALRERAA